MYQQKMVMYLLSPSPPLSPSITLGMLRFNGSQSKSKPISEVWGSQPFNLYFQSFNHYFQSISLVEKRWELFTRQCGSPLCVTVASPVKSDFMLWDDLFNYCRADLESHLPDSYLADSFDTWLCLHPFHSQNSSNCYACLHSMFYTRSAKPVTIYACMGVHKKKCVNYFKWRDVRTMMLGNVWASLWHLLETVIAVWF